MSFRYEGEINNRTYTKAFGFTFVSLKGKSAVEAHIFVNGLLDNIHQYDDMFVNAMDEQIELLINEL